MWLNKNLKNKGLKEKSNKKDCSSSFINKNNNLNDFDIVNNEKINIWKNSIINVNEENKNLKNKLTELEALFSNNKDQIEEYEDIIWELDENYKILLKKYNKLLIEKDNKKII